MRTLSIFIFCLIFYASFAQDNQSEYLEARRQFKLGNYSEACGGFQSVTDDPTFGAYASFYFALSAHKMGQIQKASDMWKQILSKYPTWDQKKEVNYWLSRIAFEKGNYKRAFSYSNKLPDDLERALVYTFLKDLEYEILKDTYKRNPENEQIAVYLAKAIVNQPYAERDSKLLLSLTKKFNISVQENVSDLPLIKKGKYNVALVLPFMFESLALPQSVIRNSIIFDLYQGMLLAQMELSREDIYLEFFPYDTRKQKSKTQQIVDSCFLDGADVIIGPLYPGPNEVIRTFSMKKKIPTINPLSSNGSIIGNNPHAFLFKPSYATQGRVAADYAIEKFQHNKNAFVFFETPRDKVVAQVYKNEIEAAGFKVIRFDRLTNKDALQLRTDFTSQYKKSLDNLTQEEMDSINRLPDRFVRSRVIRDKETGRIQYDEDGEKLLEYYEMKFKVEDNSIGHIFGATSSNLLANNLISLVDVRKDSIGLIGYENWLDFDLVSYNQLERLGIAFINTIFFTSEEESGLTLRAKDIFYTKIGEYHKLGYELIMHLGHLMDEEGRYFQRGFLNGRFRKGYLMEGLKYGLFNDNQVVPVTTLENLQLKAINKKQYED